MIGLPINFDGKLWSQGKSLLVTVPKHIADEFSLVEGDNLQVFAARRSKEEIEEEAAIRKIMASYREEAEGVLINDGEEIAKLSKVFMRRNIIRGGIMKPGQSFESLPETHIAHGVILEGFMGEKAKDHFKHLTQKGKIGDVFLYGAEMKLKSKDGKVTVLRNLRFENEAPVFGRINKLRFDADIK